MNVAFLGLGLMGEPMAGHLLKAGHTLSVYNRTTSKAAGLKAAGAAVCATPAEAAKGKTIVFSCLGDGPDVAEILVGKDGQSGAASGAAKGTLFVDHSTIAPKAAQALEANLSARGMRFIDAPVTGGQKGAQDGALSIMCGGSDGDFAEAQAVMAAYAKKSTLVGGPGMGQVAKACNQVLVVSTLLGIAEALALAKSLGADPNKVVDAVRGGAAGSWALENYGPKILREDDSAGFFIKHQQKDLRIVLDSGRETNTPLPGTALIHELYKMLQARGGNELGNHALYRALRILKGEDWKA